jgi:hypothetical protein
VIDNTDIAKAVGRFWNIVPPAPVPLSADP